MTPKLERARGTRDFSGGEALQRQKVVETLRGVFELYGYSPLETPILERFETLASKYAGGEEILKETFKLTDQGGRELGLRYDLTVPMCRFIAMNPNLKMPFKRYQIGEVFRDGPLKTGRYREFMQCDVDIVGVKSMTADAEMVEIALNIFDALKLDVRVFVNNRKILDAALKACGVKEDKLLTAILIFDKLEKIGIDGVKKEFDEAKIGSEKAQKLYGYLRESGSNSKKLENLKVLVGDSKEGQKGIREIEELLSFLPEKKVGAPEKVIFSGTLARGLAYYTGTVFEVFLSPRVELTEIKSAVAAGGRYDKMIGSFIGSGREYPAVGISFGVDVIEDALRILGRGKRKTTTKVYVIPIKQAAAAKKIANQLRQKGINTDIDMSNRDVKKNLQYAAAAEIPYVVFVGEKEVKERKIKIKDMSSGKEETLTVAEFVAKIPKILR